MNEKRVAAEWTARANRHLLTEATTQEQTINDERLAMNADRGVAMNDERGTMNSEKADIFPDDDDRVLRRRLRLRLR